MNFAQKESETFYQCWERFKDLLNSCPHHGYENWRVISFSYESLTPKMHQFVETMCNGEFFSKEPDDAFEYFDYLAENAQSWDTTDVYDRSRRVESENGKYSLKEEDDLRAKLTLLTRKIDAMELKKVNEVHATPTIHESCSICEDNSHSTKDCPTIPAFKEVLMDKSNEVNMVSKPFSGPYSNTYNSGWRNHPNFNWRSEQHQVLNPTAAGSSQCMQQPAPLQKNGLEDTVQQLSTTL